MAERVLMEITRTRARAQALMEDLDAKFSMIHLVKLSRQVVTPQVMAPIH